MQWMAGAIALPHFPRAHVSAQARSLFINQIEECMRKNDVKKFKAAVKAFCGGKKKGTAGMPPSRGRKGGREQEEQQEEEQVDMRI
eukprot:evm.model.NODE_25915_length_48178_cov_38.282433.13